MNKYRGDMIIKKNYRTFKSICQVKNRKVSLNLSELKQVFEVQGDFRKSDFKMQKSEIRCDVFFCNMFAEFKSEFSRKLMIFQNDFSKILRSQRCRSVHIL